MEGEMLIFFPPPGKAGKSLTRLGGGAAGAGGSLALDFSETESVTSLALTARTSLRSFLSTSATLDQEAVLYLLWTASWGGGEVSSSLAFFTRFFLLLTCVNDA